MIKDGGTQQEFPFGFVLDSLVLTHSVMREYVKYSLQESTSESSKGSRFKVATSSMSALSLESSTAGFEWIGTTGAGGGRL
jgi:hypothetical protein